MNRLIVMAKAILLAFGLLSNSTQAGDLRIQTLVLPLRTPTSGTIATPAETDRFTFEANAGQRLFFDALEADGEDMRFRIAAPSGHTVLENSFRVDDAGPVILNETGTYMITVDGTGMAVGDYAFQVLDLASSTNINLGVQQNGALTPSTAAHLYKFDGLAGQVINVEFQPSPGAPHPLEVMIVSPNNSLALTANASPASAALHMTGVYYVLVKGLAEQNDPVSYSFKITAAGNIPAPNGIGVVYQGTLEAGQERTITYTVPRLSLILFDSLKSDSQVSVEFKNPAGEIMRSQTSTFDASGITHLAGGSYTLILRNSGGSAAEYKFRLLDLAASSAAIATGTDITRNLNALEAHILRVDNVPGQRFYLDSLESDAENIQFQLVAHGGAAGEITIYGGHNDLDFNPVNVRSGPVYLIIYNNGDTAADARLRLIGIGQPPAKTAAFDTLITNRVDGLRADVYTFAGVKGQRLFFDGRSESGSASMSLYNVDPGHYNSQIAWANITGDFEVTLPATGTYVLTINASTAEPVNYAFAIVTSGNITTSLTLGQVHSGNLSEPGEEHHFVFEGTKGKRLYYDALDADFDNISVRLVEPDGVVLFHINSDSDNTIVTLKRSGQHRLIVGGNTDVLGDFKFRLIDVSQNPASELALDTDFNGNTDSGKAKLLTFQGSQGQRLFFNGLSTNSGTTWTLYFPDNNQGSSASTMGDFVSTLPQTGQYVLVVKPETGLTNHFKVRIVTPETIVTNLVLGAVQTGTLNEPGEERHFLFNGAKGQRIFYDGQGTDLRDFAVRLLDQNNALLWSPQHADDDIGPYTLRDSGSYRLIIGGLTEALAPFRFRLLNLADAPVATASLNGQLNPGTEADLYKISAPVGARVQFQTGDFTGTGGSWRLIAPNDDMVVGGALENDSVFATLTQGGDYLLAVQGDGTDLNPGTYNFTITTTAPTVEPEGFDTIKTGTFAGAEVTFTFSAPAGLPILYDAMAPLGNFPIKLTLAGEDLEIFRGNGEADYGPLILPKTGDYVLTVGDANSAGDYRFRVLNLNLAPMMEFGATVSNTDDQARARVYRFNATAGQLFMMDALGEPNSPTVLHIFDSTMARILGGCGFQYCYNPGDDLGPILITETGVHYLLLSHPVEASSYSFRLQDLNSASAQVRTLVLDQNTTGQIDFPRGIVHYRFTGAAKQRLYLDGPGGSPATWTLFDPNGSHINSSFALNDLEVVLPLDGTYLLSITAPTAESFSFKVITPSTITTNLTLGQPITKTLLEAGEEHHYVFQGTAGQRFYYDALDNDFDTVSVHLFAPSGILEELFGSNADSDRAPFALRENGPYTLVLNSNTDVPVDYSFRLLDVTAPPFITLDTPLFGTLPMSNQVQVFAFRLPEQLNLFFQSLSNSPSWVSIYDPRNGGLGSIIRNSYTELRVTDPGEYLVVISSPETTNDVPYSFIVTPANHPPSFQPIGNRVIKEEALFTVAPTFFDPELPNDTLTFSLDPGAPSALIFDPQTGRISWTPHETNGPSASPITLTLRLFDDGIPVMGVSETFTLTVEEVNKPPVLGNLQNITANELTLIQFTATATDPDWPVNVLTFSLSTNAPAGAAIHPVTGLFTWTPGEAQAPSTNVFRVIVTDTSVDAVTPRLSDSKEITIIVREVNSRPVFGTVTGGTTAREGVALSLPIPVTDADLPANGLNFALGSGAPAGLSINPSTGVLAWTPSEVQGPGTNVVAVIVTDSGSADAVNPSLSATNMITLIVTEANVAPVLNPIGNKNVVELSPLSFTVSAADADLPANPLRFSLGAGAPVGASIDPVSGLFTWTPTEAQSGTVPLTIIVTDASSDTQAAALTHSETIAINVAETNSAPRIATIADRTVTTGTAINLTASAIDDDLPANTLTFSLIGTIPAGATINASTGAFSWTPTEAQAGTTNTIQVQVTDNGSPALSASTSFVVRVQSGATAPQIQRIQRDGPQAMTITFTSNVGRTYALEHSPKVPTASWTRLPNTTTATGTTSSLSDTNIIANPIRFYRVVLLP